MCCCACDALLALRTEVGLLQLLRERRQDERGRGPLPASLRWGCARWAARAAALAAAFARPASSTVLLRDPRLLLQGPANTVSGGVRPETIDGCGSAHLGHLGVGKNRQLEQRDVKCRTRALVPHERASQLRSGVFVTLPAGCAAYRLAYVLQQRANDVLFLLVVLVIELFLLLLLLEPPDVATREQQATLSGRQGGQQGACFLTEQ